LTESAGQQESVVKIIYQTATGEISPVFQRWFGAIGKPGEAIKVMFLLNGLPE
jgi:hypothetical protein